MTSGRLDSRSEKIFANRYRIERLIGSGGMGKVYLAHDTILNDQPVALKVLNSELGQDEVLRKRFIREVQLTRMVNHLNVVRTFDVGIHDDQLFFSMEFVEGELLKNKIAENPLDPMEAIRLLLQICDGLAAIHAQGIIHRDLKSSNIILTSAGDCKITDFGVAKPGNSDLTAQDELVGSATHMAPEVWQQGEVTEATDIYALGIIAYELLTGVLPFDGRSPHEFMWKHLKQAPVPLFELNPSVPRWLSGIVIHMLEKAPANRPQTIGAVATQIKAKLRKATLENAQRSQVLGTTGDTEEDELPPEPESELDDLLDSDEDELEFGAYAPESSGDMHALTKASFSAQPAVISNPDDEFAVPPADWNQAASEVSTYIPSIKENYIYPALSVMPRVLVATTLVAALVTMLALTTSWVIPLTAFTKNPKLPIAEIFMHYSATICLCWLMGLAPIIILSAATQPLKRAFATWLQACAIGASITVLLLLWHAGELVSWSYSVASPRDTNLLVINALRATLLDITKLSVFEPTGLLHRIVPAGNIPHFASSQANSLFIPHHLIALAILLYSLVASIQCLLNQRLRASRIVSALGVIVMFAMVAVLHWTLAPEANPLSPEVAGELGKQREVVTGYSFGPLTVTLPAMIGWAVTWGYLMLFIIIHQVLARSAELKRQREVHAGQSSV